MLAVETVELFAGDRRVGVDGAVEVQVGTHDHDVVTLVQVTMSL